jgi:hypothetical protein
LGTADNFRDPVPLVPNSIETASRDALFLDQVEETRIIPYIPVVFINL